MTHALTPGVVGYLDNFTARPGEEITLRVSVLDRGGRYRASLVRLISGETGPKGNGLREERIALDLPAEHMGSEQPVELGSYAIVEDLPALGAVEMEILAWPTLPGRAPQALMSLGPVRLILDAAGAPAIVVAGATLSTGTPLRARAWYRIAARYDPATGLAMIRSTPLPGLHADPPNATEGPLKAGVVPSAPLLIAAARAPDGNSALHFDGKLEAPLLHTGGSVFHWYFARGIGTTDIVGTRAGHTVNAPKRAVTGSTWDGSVQDWRQDPAQYAAIHFHSDDLYDVRWQPSLKVRLPETLKSGVYALKLESSGPAFYVGFGVSPKPGAPTAKLAVLASTATYLAYANYRRRMAPGAFDLSMGALPTVDMTDILLARHPEFGSSTYDVHRDGSGVSYASARRPLFNFRPTGRFWNFAMDLSLIDWLESQGIVYDVITDHELHEKGAALLQPYRAVTTLSHPEYHSLEMLRAIESYLDGGGRFLYLGGNGFYWRITFDEAHPGLIEMRRAEDGTRAWAEEPGQYYHASGEYGGLWRRIGRPPNKLVGIGFIAQGFDASSHYRRTAASRDPRAAFLFEGIDEEIIGDFGAWGDGAAGLEIDCYDSALGSPPHALVVASSEDHSNAFLLVNEEIGSNSRGVDGTLSPRVRADIVFFETPAGGAVLSTGSIAFVASLPHKGGQNNVSRLIKNALDRFLDPAPFVLPTAQPR
ncbi:MAG TPA: N,N-dimethylformamidase beta subunit family domain-containing protein [Stellaceae bacterium]|nr:N,N-dimethylformamidase beta subunit family domain-containing protein [Stellaceae bacterium]